MPDQTLDLLDCTADDPGRRVLLRGGYVLSMEGAGDFVGDVLIEGSEIAAVGRGVVEDSFDGIEIDAAGAIVMPGFVDSHVHAWQGAISGLFSDTNLPEYLAAIRGASFGPPVPPGIAACYEAADMRIGNLATSLRCLDSGVTCVIDNSHNSRTFEHASSAVEGLRDAGIRAVHACGEPLVGQDLARLRAQLDESRTLLLAGYGAEFDPFEPDFWKKRS